MFDNDLATIANSLCQLGKTSGMAFWPALGQGKSLYSCTGQRYSFRMECLEQFLGTSLIQRVGDTCCNIDSGGQYTDGAFYQFRQFLLSN
ncbi:hypothetical protein B9Y74_16760 [Stenotrophomonas maltophilia]|nr:hypothetical protein B9Y74_16760 [Stenotrophomonas maltophilia]